MNKNFRRCLLCVIFCMIVLLSGVSYGYFTADISGDGITQAQVSTEERATLTFSKGQDLSMNINHTNFEQGLGNVTGTTTSNVILSSPSLLTELYNVYIDIKANDHIYTTSNSTPELLLKVVKDGVEITSIEGLEYHNGDVSGFDVTTKSGLISLAENVEITTADEITQSWTFDLIYVNLDTDQSANTGKLFNSEINLTHENLLDDSSDLDVNQDVNGVIE